MNQIEVLYRFIDHYISSHALRDSRIALKASRELLEGIIRINDEFDRKGVLQQTYFEHALFVTKLLIDLNIPLTEKETDILIASALCHDTIAHANFKKCGKELTEDYHMDPRVYEIVRVTTKIDICTEADLQKFYDNIKVDKLAVLIAMADRSNLVENVYALSISEALYYIREVRDYALPMCSYALEHYPEIHFPLKLLVSKIHRLIDVTDIISRRYQEKENAYKKEIISLMEENAKLRGLISGL
ncbi:MAG: hypothetical protein IJ061_00480 [Lachnospiraceae bacterium]|nr:hypothetical protein [Lachnospiraceae bacterium]